MDHNDKHHSTSTSSSARQGVVHQRHGQEFPHGRRQRRRGGGGGANDGDDDNNNKHRNNMISKKDQHTRSVIRTADDAAVAKLSAISMGYYNDPFLSHFASDASSGLTSTGSVLPPPPPPPSSSPPIGAFGLRQQQQRQQQQQQQQQERHTPPPRRTLSSPPEYDYPSHKHSHHPATLAFRHLHQHHHGGGAAHHGGGTLTPPKESHNINHHNSHDYHYHSGGTGRHVPLRQHHHFHSHSRSIQHPHHQQQQQQQQPIIRRGTHARICCVDRAIASFIQVFSTPCDDSPKIKQEETNNKMDHRDTMTDSTIITSDEMQKKKKKKKKKTSCTKNDDVDHVDSDGCGSSSSNTTTPTTTERRLQIVILGSGRDTTFLRYRAGLLTTTFTLPTSAAKSGQRQRQRQQQVKDDDKDKDNAKKSNDENENDCDLNVQWYEVDHPSVIRMKHDLLTTFTTTTTIEKMQGLEWTVSGISSSSSSSTTTAATAEARASMIQNKDNHFKIQEEEEEMDIEREEEATKKSPFVSDCNHDDQMKTDKDDDNDNDNEEKEPKRTGTKTSSTATTTTTTTRPQYASASAFASLSSSYHLIGQDLQSSPTVLFDKLVTHHGFCVDAPTLFVLECVQMYLPDTASRNLLSTISETCATPLIALYDPILLNDPFGKVMENHLTKAGVINPTISLSRNRTLQSQVDKLTSCNFNLVVGCDMMSAYETVVTPKQRMHANQCEMLDEIEEWVLIMRHYCFVVAGRSMPKMTRSSSGSGDSDSDDVIMTMVEKYCSVGRGSPLGFVEGRCVVSRRGVEGRT